jgi:hypothetical protein
LFCCCFVVGSCCWRAKRALCGTFGEVADQLGTITNSDSAASNKIGCTITYPMISAGLAISEAVAMELVLSISLRQRVL